MIREAFLPKRWAALLLTDADGLCQGLLGTRIMQILTVLGSPRRHGNTAKALRWVEDQFRATDTTSDHINILDYNVGGCRECLVCKKGGTELCVLEDDAIGLFRADGQGRPGADRRPGLLLGISGPDQRR